MDNVSQEKNVSQKNKGAKKMRREEKMSVSINEFIVNSDFLIGFIVDNVKDKIYDTKEYNDSIIQYVIENDLNNAYSNSYITDFILDEIDVYTLTDIIHERFKDDFQELEKQCNTRYN